MLIYKFLVDCSILNLTSIQIKTCKVNQDVKLVLILKTMIMKLVKKMKSPLSLKMVTKII